jgi:hypothetical protein
LIIAEDMPQVVLLGEISEDPANLNADLAMAWVGYG